MIDEAKPNGVVLMIDDSPDSLRFLADALDVAGMTVLVATGGGDALTLLDEVTPDIVLMDAVMPGMDGFETCRRMKRSPRLKDVPVIFMTGLSETEHVIEGLEAGGVDYVTKPVILDELIARIQVHRNNARVARSRRLALESAGRALLAVNRNGDILWITPQAETLMRREGWNGARLEGAEDWLKGAARDERLPALWSGDTVAYTFIAVVDDGEFLLAAGPAKALDEAAPLKERYALTSREAEVLMWIAKGKSNRDIGEILGLSPRTVNKHLEQIFAKLGVENRTAAAAIAITARTLNSDQPHS